MQNACKIMFLLSLGLLLACKGNKKNEAVYESSKQFSGLIADLNSKFTTKAAYSSIMLSYDKLLGNSILVKVARNMDSTRLEEWFFMNGGWEKKSEFQLELENLKPSDLLFTINGDFDLSKLVEMVDVSKEKVESEKKAKKVECKSVSILMKNIKSSIHKMDGLIIQINVESIVDKKSYDLSFNSKGDFESFLN